MEGLFQPAHLFPFIEAIGRNPKAPAKQCRKAGFCNTVSLRLLIILLPMETSFA
jgi:hypothetical protein